MTRTENDKRSYDRNERNVHQGTVESVTAKMLLEAETLDTGEVRDQKARHQHVNHRHNHRQRRDRQRRHQCHHEENRPNAPPKLLEEALPSLRHFRWRNTQPATAVTTSPRVWLRSLQQIRLSVSQSVRKKTT